MSNNLIKTNTLENFAANPGYSDGNVYDKTKSFSALNKGTKNLHNSIFSDLVPGQNEMIIKQNQKFENVNKINPYFYNEKPGGAGECLNECKKVKQCAAYTYDKIDGDCELYNTVPNKFVEDNSKISGYSVKYDYDMDNLDDNQVTNVQNRIGSMYLQQKFDIVNTEKDKNITKCLRPIPGETNIKMNLEITTGWGSWDDTDRILQVYLYQTGQGRVSNVENFDGTLFQRGSTTIVEANFSLTSQKFNYLFFQVGNDGIGLKTIKLGVNIDGNIHNIYTQNFNNIWIKNTYRWFYLKQMDVNNLEFKTAISSKIYKGNFPRTTKYSVAECKDINDIIKNSNFSVSFDYMLTKSGPTWTGNIFQLRTNTQYSINLWVFNNWSFIPYIYINGTMSAWYMHLPRQFRKYNQNIHIELEFFQYTNEYNNQPGFIMNATVNGIFVNAYNNNRGSFNFKPEQYLTMNENSSQMVVKTLNVQFNYNEMKLLTTGRGWGGKYENRNNFNQLINNLPLPWYIVRIGYSDYRQQYNLIVYKRLTSSKSVDVWSLFHENWFDQRRNVKNTFNKDFELYSTLNDAIAGRGRWRFCNFNDPGIGFPRDCGVERGVGSQWQSKRRGGKTTWKIYVYDNRSSYLNSNLKNPFFGTVKGYEADPKCAYQNIPKPNNVFNRNIKALSSTNDPFNLKNSSDIDKNLHYFNKDMNNMTEFKNELNNLNSQSPQLSMLYDENTRKLLSIKKSKGKTADITGLKKAVGGKIFEKFENDCNANSKYLNYIVIIIILLILFYFFSK